MNPITILLSATGVLLLAAVALSIGVMKSRSDASEAEKLRAEIAALRAANQPARARPLVPPAAPPVASLPLVSPSAVPVVPAARPLSSPSVVVDPAPATASSAAPLQPRASETATAPAPSQLEKELELAERIAQEERELIDDGIGWAAKVAADEENMARAKAILETPLLARVTQWDATHGFAVIEILAPESVQVGTSLAIRRQSGIAGQLDVVKLYPNNQATANPDEGTFLGENGIDVQPGDELVLPPL